MSSDRHDNARDGGTVQKKPMGRADTANGEELPFGKHYTVAQFAESLNIGRESARRLVMHEPDVIKMRMGRKKAHTHYLIPEAVARRIYTRLKNAS